MLARKSHYPNTRKLEDVLKAQQDNQENLFFADVHASGEYPKYLDRFLVENDIEIVKEIGGDEILKQYPVDYISFSYYMSMVSPNSPEGEHTEGIL